MAGGSPFEIYNVFGMKICRWQMAAYTLGAYFGIYMSVSQYNKLKPKQPIKFDSPDEEAFVKKYIDFAHEQAKKPEILRTPFSA